MEVYRRRVTDGNAADIEALIAKENDPNNRMYLIILSSINQSLIANTTSLISISEKLDSHLTTFELHIKAEDAMINRGRGMWYVMGSVLALAQLWGGYTWIQMRTDMESIHTAIVAAQIVDARTAVQVEGLSNRISDHLGLPKPDAMGLHK